MARAARRSGWRIGHLIGSVVATALVLALAIRPGENAQAIVSGAGLLLIASCVGTAVVNSAGDRRARAGGQARR